MMRTSNPALNADTFTSARGTYGAMTINGTVNKTFVLLLLVAITARWAWTQIAQAAGLVTLAAIAGFVVALVTVFKKEWAAFTAPIYALLEGLVLGAISALFEVRYPGIVIQAVFLTFGTLLSLLIAYKSGFIKATENFKLGVFAATGGIALVYLATLILGFFKVRIPYIYEAGPIGIVFSLFVVIIAALNLVLDFDFIEQGARQGAPKYMEWYAGFGLMVTLIWLYIEILRLLSKMRRR
jgi:uncharacterized YccA/Bax inhibitor family protein